MPYRHLRQAKTGVSAILALDECSVRDMTEQAVRDVSTGDIVVAQVYSSEDMLKATTIVRQFVAPSLLVTNRNGVNTAVDMESSPLDIAIKGVRVKD